MTARRIFRLSQNLPRWVLHDVFLPLLATRIALCLVALLGFWLSPLRSAFPLSWEVGADGARHFTSRGVPSTHPFVNMWSRWDSGWYLEIAKVGYHYEQGKPSSTAFFPFYPLTIRFLHTLFFLPESDYWYLIVAIIVSNICLFAGGVYLHALTRLDYDARLAHGAVLLLLLFPTSFFLSAAYSEAMFFLLTVSSFYYARRQRWLAASILAALATLCRSMGVILIVPLLVEYFAQCRFNVRTVKWNLASLSLVPACLLIFMSYFRLEFGSWTILFDSQGAWGRRLLAPWYTLGWVLHHASTHDWLDFSFLVLLALIAVVGIWCLRLFYASYLLTAVIFFSSWGMLGSLPRFVLVIFPVFIVLALAGERSRGFRIAFLTLSFLLGAVFFFMHSQWNWIA